MFGAGDAHAFEHLDAGAVAFDDLHADAQRVAGAEFGDVLVGGQRVNGFALERLDQVHCLTRLLSSRCAPEGGACDAPPWRSIRSGRLSRVSSTARCVSPRRDLRMIPRPQHFGDRAPFPCRLVGYSADIRGAPLRSSPPLRWRPRPLPREAAERKRRAAPSRQARRRRGHNRRSRPARSARASKIRSSNPSKRPQRRIDPLARRQLADARLGQRRAARGHAPASGGRRRRCPARPRARRGAAPSPPRRPAGVSSTLRCLSVAKSRMLRRVERPDALAERLARPGSRPAAPETSPG